LDICLKRMGKTDFKILEGKKMGKRIQELKYIKMLKSTRVPCEGWKSMDAYLII